MQRMSKTMLALAWASSAAMAQAATELVIATVNNGHMIELQKRTPQFEKAHPGITLKWVMLEEGVLRQRVTTDIATRGGQFDVLSVGLYEVPIWSKKGWLLPIATDAAYDQDDLLPTIREGVSHEGRLHASPFYGEASILMYRKDLADKVGFRMPERPTWTQLRDFAAKVHDPQGGVYGICLRGKPGWGDNMALITTMANAHGGQWFDMQWKPQLESPAWKQAVGLYVDLLKSYGPPGASANSFNENLALFSEGKCGAWVDSSIAAAFVSDARQSKVADKVAYAAAPMASTTKGASWLWTWNLAIPAHLKKDKIEAAQTFVKWATSQDYVKLVARESGWQAVPTGTRRSTYASPEFQKAAAFAAVEQQAIESVSPTDPTEPRSPYVGVQYVAIPEFQAIGIAVGQQMSAALSGKTTVEQALKASQTLAEREMRKSGYYR